MNKKLVILLTVMVTAVFLILGILPAAAIYPRNPSLDFAPIPVQPYSGFDGEGQGAALCSSTAESSTGKLPLPLLDGSGIFQDTKLDMLTISPAHPVAVGAACTISTLLSES